MKMWSARNRIGSTVFFNCKHSVWFIFIFEGTNQGYAWKNVLTESTGLLKVLNVDAGVLRVTTVLLTVRIYDL